MVLSGPTQNLLEVKGKITLARSWHHKFTHFITDTCCLCIFAYYCIQTKYVASFKSACHIYETKVFMDKEGKSEGFDSCDWPCNLKWNPNRFLIPCDLKIWQTTSWKKGTSSMLSKLWVSFRSHPWIQIGVVSRKHSNWSQILDFTAPVTLKFGRSENIVSHLFYATSSFVHHFEVICTLKLE